jgi:hypothetical protein
MDKYLSHGNYICLLLKALIKGEEPTPPDFEIDWEFFYQLCLHHKIGNMIYVATKKLEIPLEIKNLLADDYKKFCVREAKQELFAQKLYKAFEEEKISFLPVKGILIKKLYPVENYRGSNDIDILIKKEDFKKAQAILENMGFSPLDADTQDNDYHIEYHKKMLSIEIHSSLTPNNATFYSYFENAFDKAVKCDNSNFHYKMTDEDFYIYVLYHLYKHFIKGGVGIRYFLDMHLINKKMEFNQEYIEKELASIGLNKFNQCVKELCQVFFNDKKADDRLKELSRFIFISGAHGEKTFFAMAQFSGAGTKNNNYTLNKIKYFFHAWFIGKKGMAEKYPILVKHPLMLPLCYIHKGFYTLIKKPAAIKQQASDIKNLNKDVSGYVESINKMAGL